MTRAINFTSALLAGFLALSAPVHAETFKCTTKTHSETTDDGILVPATNKMFIGKSFTVDVITGEWSGSPADNQTVPDRKVEIVDPGNPEMSVTIITTRGGSIGHLADLLVIRTWAENKEKPFNYYDANNGYFTGTCTRL